LYKKQLNLLIYRKLQAQKLSPLFFKRFFDTVRSLPAPVCNSKNKEDLTVKTNILRFVQWFCRQLTFNELASIVPILQDVLNGSRHDISLKTENNKPPHYRQFKVDPLSPLTSPPESSSMLPTLHWQQIQDDHFEKTGIRISPVQRRSSSVRPPEKCVCQHCGAPGRYLYLNNGQLGSQVLCKLCHKTSPTHQCRRDRKTSYWCPHCGYALFHWKEDGVSSAYKCPNKQCPLFLENLAALTPEEKRMREEGKTSQFKLHYLFREYHYGAEGLSLARPENAPVNLNKIHNNLHIVGLCLTFVINLGLSLRLTRDALERIFDFKISHQTIANYVASSAAYLSSFIDRHCPTPVGIAAADETYITVEAENRYTWFILDESSRAICAYNLSDTRGTLPALALLSECFGDPETGASQSFCLVTDGNPAYGSAVVAYNTTARQHAQNPLNPPDDAIQKRTVIGLQNNDPESEEYRTFKQLIERLNRTYKFHTRPRAGFKSFDGAVVLTTLFVAFYNFMRPHGRLKDQMPPVALPCLQHKKLYPEMWVTLLRKAA